jgi:hypothetical protein
MNRAELGLLLLLASCSNPTDGLADLQRLDDAARDYAQGCDWREAPDAGYDPREPADCYNVFTGPHARLSTFRLANPCDAPALVSPTLVEPGAPLWGYYDRSEVAEFKILRYERLESCP